MSRGSRDLPGSRGPDLGEVSAAFGHLLHRAGVPVTPERSTRFGAAIALAEPTSVRQLYWLGRTTLLTGRDQIEQYDAIFDQVFRGIVDFGNPISGEPQPTLAAPAEGGDQESIPGEVTDEMGSPPETTGATPESRTDETDDKSKPSVLAAMSVEERLAEKEFAACTPDELQLIADLIARLPLVPPRRQARRTRVRSRGDRWDVRRTLRASRRTGGEPIDLVRRARADRPRRIVLIADISGSMEPYARVYLHLMRGAVRALGAEAFLFATRLTRVTRMLADVNADAAYRKAAAAAPDWSGGTRIGRALLDFVELYGRRGMARGAVVVIVSDGWEVENPAIVATAMERLHRLAHHTIWVNPRKAARDFQPLAGGMAAAMPFVDTFVSGHSLRAIEEVLHAIRTAERSAQPRVIAC